MEESTTFQMCNYDKWNTASLAALCDVHLLFFRSGQQRKSWCILLPNTYSKTAHCYVQLRWARATLMQQRFPQLFSIVGRAWRLSDLQISRIEDIYVTRCNCKTQYCKGWNQDQRTNRRKEGRVVPFTHFCHVFSALLLPQFSRRLLLGEFRISVSLVQLLL